MAIQNLQFSVSVIDADGNVATMPMYAKYDDSSATLADILAFLRVTTGYLDSITDAKVTGISAILDVTLPLGLKASPVTGSNVQEGGLISFSLTGLANRSFGQWVPAFIQAGFTGKTINQAYAQVATWISRMTTGSTLSHTDDKFGYLLTVPVQNGVKSFRKR